MKYTVLKSAYFVFLVLHLAFCVEIKLMYTLLI